MSFRNIPPSAVPPGEGDPHAPAKRIGSPPPAGYTRRTEITETRSETKTECRTESYVAIPDMPTHPRGQDVDAGDGDPKDDRDEARGRGLDHIAVVALALVGAIACFWAAPLLTGSAIVKVTITLQLSASGLWVLASGTTYLALRIGKR